MVAKLQTIVPQSLTAQYFFSTLFEPKYQQLWEEVTQTKVKVQLCIPQSTSEYQGSNLIVSELTRKAEQDSIKLNVCVIGEHIDTAIFELNQQCSEYDVVFIVPAQHKLPLRDFSQNLSKKTCFLYFPSALKQYSTKGYDSADLAALFKKTFATAYPVASYAKALDYTVSLIEYTRIVKAIFLKLKAIHDDANIKRLFHVYAQDITLLKSPEHACILGFLAYYGDLSADVISKHWGKSVSAILRKLSDNNYIQTNAENMFSASSSGLELAQRVLDLKTLEAEKKHFSDRWLEAIDKTLKSTSKLRDIQDTFKEKAEAFSNYREDRFLPWWLYWVHQNPVEKLYMQFANNNDLFKTWKQLWGGYEDWFPQTRFLRHMEKLHRIAFAPKGMALRSKYSDALFGLKIQHKNNWAYIYLGYSFDLRKKEYIKEYWDLAIANNDLEFFLMRQKSHHMMLNLHSTPGDRTPFDSRGLDFKPLMYPLNFQYTVSLQFSEMRTRRVDYNIAIPHEIDEKAALFQESRIGALSKRVASEDLLSHFYFRKGEMFKGDPPLTLPVWRRFFHFFTRRGKQQEKPKPVKDYGFAVPRILENQIRLTLEKTKHTPKNGLGLTLRFKLREPIAAFIGGLHRSRKLNLDEIIHIIYCLAEEEHQNKQKKDATETPDDECKTKKKNKNATETPDEHKTKKKNKKDSYESLYISDEIIHTIFSEFDNHRLSDEQAYFIHKLTEIRADSEDDAWRYLTQRMIDGELKPLLQIICHCLSKTGLDLVFSLKPLLTGEDFRLTDEDLKAVHDPKQRAELTDIMMQHNGEVRILNLVEILEQTLGELLDDVFTKYIDISPITQYENSEAKFAELILEGCLNKSDTQMLRHKLRQHLKKHYALHRSFLRDAYMRMPPTTTKAHARIADWWYKLYGNKKSVMEMIESDTDQIIKLVERTRTRLFTREQSNRLLCFIDPSSVEVLIGKFAYSGHQFEQEYEFFQSYLDIMRRSSTRIRDLEELAKAAALEQEEAKFTEQMNDAKIAKLHSEIQLEIARACKNGELEKYLALSIYDYHHRLGPPGVSEYLNKFHNILHFNHELHDSFERSELREKIVQWIEHSQVHLTPANLHVLLSDLFGRETLFGEHPAHASDSHGSEHSGKTEIEERLENLVKRYLDQSVVQEISTSDNGSATDKPHVVSSASPHPHPTHSHP